MPEKINPCPQCKGEKDTADKYLCSRCAKAFGGHNKKYRAGLKAKGLCYKCRAVKEAERMTKTMCGACAEKHAIKINEKRNQNGIEKI